ncbi:molybdenum cofactor guanylyltransferase [Larkinella sp. VNQ87]|uniref:molybdenum cofactor guanylyltransferase n=1 Tax=Larkinella sp. VNQ87 TaxID=3400921 RepID=UPI003C010261
MTSTKPTEPTPPLWGLVLAGGRSTRMGVDKSTLAYHGKPQFEYLYDLLSSYCDDVFLSVNAEQAAHLADSRFQLLVDAAPVEGPLAGILTAFQSGPENPVAWLAVVCDLPLLSETSLRKLALNRQPDTLATAFWDSDHQFPDPSVCIWEPAAYPAMLQALADGKPYPRLILMQHDCTLLDIDDVNELTNVNTPELAAKIQQNLNVPPTP